MILQRLRDERGSAPAEFVMVGAMLTVLTLSVLQLALGLHVRNTVLDAASEGARYAALADNTLGDGTARTRQIVASALGGGYPVDVTTEYGRYLGVRAVVVTARTRLPLIGLIGVDAGLEVTGHAAVETLP